MQERVGPVVATRSARQDDFSVLQADDGLVGGQAHPRKQGRQHVAPNVAAQGRDGVRGESMLLGHHLHAAVPELSGGLGTHGEHVVRHAVHAAVKLHVAGDGPGVKLLESKQRIAAASARGFLDR